ncbi:MAG: binding-protein-dependent transport system inner rane component [Acidimicrobiales bacterium]|nr:binding-protein-dependent transport system inner rane component [Acidimicrobiales bacterium]
MSDQALGFDVASRRTGRDRAHARQAIGAPTSPAPALASPTLTRLPTGHGDAKTGGRRRFAAPRGLERLVGVVLLIALWQIAADVGWLRSDILAGPSVVVTAGADLWRNGTLPHSLVASVTRVAWGLGIGVPVGTVLALASGLSRTGDDLIDANVQMLRFVPIIALQPLLIVWLGVGETVKITMIVIGVAFPIYVNTSTAIKTLDPGYRELGEVVGLNRRQLVRRVVLPGALPGFLVGLRLAAAIAWLLLVFAETINATSGIGFMMARAQVFFQTDVIVVGLVTYAVLGLLTDGTVRFLERRLLRWQPGR